MPTNEAARLQNLRDYAILDTSPDRNIDDLVFLAAHVCGTPMASVSFIDADRQWFKSRIGIDAAQTPRDVAFCAHTILRNELFVVNDALEDPRFADNPLVVGEPHIRFYAAAPLVTPEGYELGAICVADRIPRELTRGQARALLALSRQVVCQLRLRRTLRELPAGAAAEIAAAEPALVESLSTVANAGEGFFLAA